MAARLARAAAVASLAGTLGMSAGAAAFSHLGVGAPAPLFSALGSDGRRHRLQNYSGRLVVLEWTSPVCPFTAVKYHNGAMQALQRYAASRHIVWLSVDTAAPGKAGYLTAAAARNRIAATHATVSAFLFDTDGSIARRYGARTTPSFFVIDRGGKLAYEGAMDEQVFGDDSVGREYLKRALGDLLGGRSVQQAETRPQGCAVEY